MDFLLSILFCLVCQQMGEPALADSLFCQQLAGYSGLQCESGTEPLTDQRSSGELKPEVDVQPKNRPIVLDGETE